MNVYPNPKPVTFFLLTLFLSLLIPSSTSLPFVVFHGLAESCSSGKNQDFINYISEQSHSKGYCIEIGNGERDSWLMPIMKQVDEACGKVMSMPELSNGFNIIGLSQGNMIARGIIELCDDAPAVMNFIGVGGPHAGVASVPKCGSDFICKLVERLLPLGVYNPIVQRYLAPTNYIRVPTDIKGYLRSCDYLPLINNEREDMRNPDFKVYFASLQKLVLVKFESDKFLVPRETSWFGYYKDGTVDTLIPFNETEVYVQDWFGLKSLDEAGKIVFISAPGDHQEFTRDLENQLVPYLT